MFNNKKVAFVASGGAARAIAHGGVLRVCEELGIVPDILIGSSAGAIGMAMYSQVPDSERMIDMFRPKDKRKFGIEFGWSKMLSLKNFFCPNIKSGLFDLTGAEEYFKKMLPINDFSKLPIKTYVSATNIQTNQGELFGSDINSHIPISKALAASCCIPIIFRPVKIGKYYYIDGEIKRPTAVNTACELGADIVIVSDVYKPITQGMENAGMFNIAAQMTNMLFEDKSMRGIKIAKDRFPDKEIILISPDVARMSAWHTYAWKELSDLGYITAKKVFSDYGL